MTKLQYDQPVIFDVGAHVGDITAIYRSLFPHAQIFCFEPIKGLANRLTTRFKGDKKICIVGRAVSDKVGKAAFYVGGREHDMSSLHPRPAHGRRYYASPLKCAGMVPTTTIDTFARERNIANVNILKLDIHGAEHAALVGASHLLEAQKIDIIFVETYFIPLYANTRLFPEICSLLGGYGYSLHSFHHVEYAKQNKQLRLANALFVSHQTRIWALNRFPAEWKRRKGAPK